MTALELFYKYHSFENEDERDDWFLSLSRVDKYALLDMRATLETDLLIEAVCSRGGVVIAVEATLEGVPT